MLVCYNSASSARWTKYNKMQIVIVQLKQHLSTEIIQMQDSVMQQKAFLLQGWNGNNVWEVQGCLLFLPEE